MVVANVGDAIPVVTGFTWTAAGAWASFLALLGLLVRQWVPLRRARIDADKLKVESDNSLRVDLMAEIRALRAEQREERADCDRRLAEQDKEIASLREEIRGLHAMIRQNSQSSAYLLGDPAAVATSTSARKQRKDEEK
jgi:hypothetical protein